MRYTCRRNNKRQKQDTRKGNQHRLVIKSSDPRRGKEKKNVYPEGYEYIEPEDRIVVLMFDGFSIDQRCGKTTVHNGIRYGCEDSQHRHQPVIVGRKDPGDRYTKSHTDHLLDEIADSAPEQTFGCFFFQCSFWH